MSRLTLTRCKYCNKEIHTATHSHYGLDALKEKYGAICQACMTPEIQHQMLDDMAKGLLQ